jgi:hypothetical protein
MSSLPPPPSYPPPSYPPPGWGPPPSYPPPPAARDRSNALRLLAVVATVVVAGAVVAFLVARRDDAYPDEWDERVADLAAFVEDERGHDFDHPVPVDFLTAEEYSERTRTDAGELDEAALEEAEQNEAQLRALGLVSGDVDLVESTNDLTDTGTLAFYDPFTERITVRGTEVDASLAVTLVHELTHVLQDQAFGLEGLSDAEATSGESFALRALVEGDAVRIENRYIEQELSDDEVAEVQGANDDGLEAIDEQAIPEALQAFFGLPYALGEGFLAALEADGGDDAVDEAFEDPPTSEEHLLDPLSYLDGDDVVEVEVPGTPSGGGVEVLDDGDFGAASLYLVLAQRIPATQALDAALGWGGDAYVDFTRGDRSCVLVDVIGDDDEDTEEIRVALEAWVEAGPAGSASVAPTGGTVQLEACDPGVDAEAGTGSAIDALRLLATRSFVLADAIDQGLPAAFAACYSRAIVGAFTVDELTGEATPADFDARLEAAAAGCS